MPTLRNPTSSTMKRATSTIAFLLLSAIGASNAWADHVRVGVMIGPYLGPGYYPPAPYYYPGYYPPVVIQQQAPVYVQQQASPVAPPASSPAPATVAPANYWYYCAAAKGYYPYVKDCPAGWQKVSPQPSGQP